MASSLVLSKKTRRRQVKKKSRVKETKRLPLSANRGLPPSLSRWPFLRNSKTLCVGEKRARSESAAAPPPPRSGHATHYGKADTGSRGQRGGGESNHTHVHQGRSTKVFGKIHKNLQRTTSGNPPFFPRIFTEPWCVQVPWTASPPGTLAT